MGMVMKTLMLMRMKIDNDSIGDNCDSVNDQVLRGHCGNPGRVTDGSKTWPRPQAQVPRNVRLSTTTLLVLSEPPLTDGACFYRLFVPTERIGCIMGLSQQGPENVLLRCDCGREFYI